MTITLIGLAVVVVSAFLGHSRGMYRILAAFLSFLLAAPFAKPLSFLFRWAVSLSGLVPRSLVPLAAQLLGGLILFGLFYYGADRILKNRENVREVLNRPRMAGWERSGGAVLGALWGLFLVIFTLTGLHLIGTVQEAFDEAAATDSEQSRPVSPLPIRFEEIKVQIEDSSFGGLVRRSDPVDQHVQEIFRNLAQVMADAELFEDFRNHPEIASFTDDPRIVAVAEDPEIQRLLRNDMYYELLDNAKIASLLAEDDLYRNLKNVDLGTVLQEVLANR